MDINRQFLTDLFKSGLAAADPLKVLPPHLPPRPKGRTIVIGAGKAAAAMTKAVETDWQGDLSGFAVTRYGYGMETDRIEIIEAAHPVPDDAGTHAAKKILDAVSDLTPDDLVLFLISGGGSSLLSLPAQGVTEEEKRAINKALLKSGMPIHEMNCVRKHLSAIKGGKLALAAHPARIVTLVISDVPGDDPAAVASGPTLPDATTRQDALSILKKYDIPISDTARSWLLDPAHETSKPGDKRFSGHETKVIARNRDALEAAAAYAASQGIRPVILGDAIEGEARTVGAEHARLALDSMDRAPCVILSGGETTVTVRGNGRGGRNTEYLLAAAMEAAGNKRIYGIACDTDGIDGSEDNAGAIFTPDSLSAARIKGIDAQKCLENNDAYTFFEVSGGLVVTGPTFTNVNDFRALLVLPRRF